jgi:hypothetical protein
MVRVAKLRSLVKAHHFAHEGAVNGVDRYVHLSAFMDKRNGILWHRQAEAKKIALREFY